MVNRISVTAATVALVATTWLVCCQAAPSSIDDSNQDATPIRHVLSPSLQQLLRANAEGRNSSIGTRNGTSYGTTGPVVSTSLHGVQPAGNSGTIAATGSKQRDDEAEEHQTRERRQVSSGGTAGVRRTASTTTTSTSRPGSVVGAGNGRSGSGSASSTSTTTRRSVPAAGNH